jgi:hypothetical protein
MVQSDHHERRFHDKHLGRELQPWKRKPFAKEAALRNRDNCVFSATCTLGTRLKDVQISDSAAYGAERESFDAICKCRIDLGADYDHDPQ